MVVTMPEITLRRRDGAVDKIGVGDGRAARDVVRREPTTRMPVSAKAGVGHQQRSRKDERSRRIMAISSQLRGRLQHLVRGRDDLGVHLVGALRGDQDR